MSFSVHARAFVPSTGSALSPSHLRESATAAAGVCKDCVCVAFYENGRCPYGNHCEHAHAFAELSQSTQTKLLASVPVESIPAHFFGGGSARDDAAASTDAAPAPSTLTSYRPYSPTRGAEEERTVSTRRRPPGKDRPLVVSRIATQTPTPDTGSLSSRTSSSAGSQRGAAASTSKSGSTSSPLLAVPSTAAAAASGMDTASFKLHLPLRCRYPHRSIPGTYYDVLALPRDAAPSDIMAKYRAWQKDGFKRMRLVDPVGADAVDRMIVEARNVLGNPALRAAYDQQLPGVCAKQQPWSAACATAASAGNGGTTSTITTPSKRCTQGQSSATSSTSETHQRVESSTTRLGYSSSSSSIYHADISAPVVTISSLRNGDSIW